MDRWLSTLTDDEVEALQYEWRYFWARKNQLAPPLIDPRTGHAWVIWLVLAGRGFGKTRLGAEWVLEEVAGGAKRIALIGPTIGDVRGVMIEGPSGILSISPPWNMPVYEPSKRHRLTWPNGAKAFGYSAEEPGRLRGPEHDRIWADEIAAWQYSEAWDMAMFGFRIGENPRACVTTTPKPVRIVRELLDDLDTIITRGTTYDNRDNLAPAFYRKVIAKYEGTRLGRQELEAEMLEDTPGALWTYGMIDATRIKHDQIPEMVRKVVAVDPSGTKGAISELSTDDKSNDVGIAVCGRGVDGHGYLLADLTINASPHIWGSRVVQAYHDHKCDRIIAETNFGGAMVESVIRGVDRYVAFKAVTASRGKSVRAEPVAALYEQKRIHHVGSFKDMEMQMTQMTSSGYLGPGSPDRLDAAVWGFTDLMLLSRIPPPAQMIKARTT